jgi:nucleotide-binding universal stress UspA family protein
MSERENEATPLRPAGLSPFHPRDVEDHLQPEAEPERPQPSQPGGRTVVGIDGSAQSLAALRWAVRYAQDTGAAVEVVAVWHQPVQFAGTLLAPAGDFEAEARKWLTEALPRLAPDEPGTHVETSLEHGDPSTVLVERARDADLLVLGNQGRGALTAAMIGSVALRCIQHARCPVVVVPTPPTMGEIPAP